MKIVGFTTRLPDDLIAQADQFKNHYGIESRNDLIEKAIRYYLTYLMKQKDLRSSA